MATRHSCVILATAVVFTAAAFETALGAEDDLSLSDEVVPYHEFAQQGVDRPAMVSETFEKLLLSATSPRPHTDGDAENPPSSLIDQRSLFGGDRFLSPGPIDPGMRLPTGSVLRPSFTAFGTLRSGVQAFDGPSARSVEWANLLELYGNIYFSNTERLLVGVRPLSRDGTFSGYTFDGGTLPRGWNDGLNFDPFALFFEGDLGEMLPFIDPNDRFSLDYGISIGRQPLVMQDGIMINDTIDSIGITRHNLFLFRASSSRISVFVGLNDIHRSDNRRDSHARLFAISTSNDYEHATIEVDAAYVRGDPSQESDGVYVGAGQIRRFGHWNSTLRANGSWALGQQSAAVSSGWLFTHELSRTLPFGDDIAYLNCYMGVDDYASAARGPFTGGPLGRQGFLNRAVGLGRYGSALGNNAGELIGAAIGFQHFFDDEAHRQMLFEIGGRTPYGAGPGLGSLGAGARYQHGIGRHLIWVLGGYASVDENGEAGYGVRSEMVVKF